MTPETENTTHYFWSVPRRFAIEDRAISDMLWNLTKNAFDEDLAVLEIQQRMIEADTSGDPLRYYKEDKAGMAVRRIIAQRRADQSRLVAAE